MRTAGAVPQVSTGRSTRDKDGKANEKDGKDKQEAKGEEEKEKKEKEEMERKEQEEKGEGGTSAVNIAVAIMLFGSITFQMALFYLVNHPDDDMKKYSWQTISSTLSIFCAVLLFQGYKGIVDWYLLGEGGVGHTVLPQVIVAMAQLAFWQLLLQCSIYFLSGAHNDDEKSLSSHSTRRLAHSLHHNAKACSILLAHITGFAAIHAFGTVQQLPFFAATPLRSFTVVLLAFLILHGLAQITDEIRERTALGDGHRSREEALWDAEVEEAEDDVIGLCGSFLTVQSIRFAIGQRLPDLNGNLPGVPSHAECLVLLVTAAVAVVGVVALVPLRLRLEDSAHGTAKQRGVAALHTIASMCFAWSLLLAIRGEVSQLAISSLGHGVMASVIIALIVSAISFLLIFVLDKIADLDATGDEIDTAIFTVILSFGIMVGFSWEVCFDTGIETISEEVFPEGAWREWSKLTMAVVLAAIALPAWRLYILPVVHVVHDHHSTGHHSPSPSTTLGGRGSPESLPLIHAERRHVA